MMTSAQVVETSVNVTSNSPSQDYTHPDDHNLPNYDNKSIQESSPHTLSSHFHLAHSVHIHRPGTKLQLLVLTRLPVRMLKQDLAVPFELPRSHVSRIITTWTNAMNHRFKEIDIWPSREQALANLSEKVKEFCPTLRCIIDATEIYIEQPKNPEAQQLTFPTYKHHNTLKSLIGISGDGVVNFVSTLEGGSVTDRDLTVRSGIREKDWTKGDIPMADKGVGNPG